MSDLFKNRIPGPAFRIVFFLLITVFIVLTRYHYGRNVPLSGDECGVAMLQAAGKWNAYNAFPTYQQIEGMEINRYIDYSPDAGLSDVLLTMRNDKLHAPAFYLLLHGQMKLFGNSLTAVRGLSVFFFLCSVIGIYLLGRVIVNERFGMLCSLLLSVSPYFLEYSIMVRPYPLMTSLTIFSSWVLIKILKQGGFHIKKPLTISYIILSVLGLYTFYSFAFLLFSHLVAVIIAAPKKSRSAIFTTGMVYFLIFIMLLPWVVPAFQGVLESQEKDQYFKGTYSTWFFFSQLIKTNLLPWLAGISLPGGWSDSMVAITGALALILPGYVLLRKREHRWPVLFTVIFLLYTAQVFVVDKILSTRSLVIDKQQYFIVCSFIILLAYGYSRFPAKPFFRYMLTGLLLVTMVAGFIYRYNHRSGFDGPLSFDKLAGQMELLASHHGHRETLIIYNTRQQRFLLPLVHRLNQDCQYFIADKGFDIEMLDTMAFRAGQHFLIVNTSVPEFKSRRLKWVNIDMGQIESKCLSENKFTIISKHIVRDTHPTSILEVKRNP